jgi:hypothetical protein
MATSTSNITGRLTPARRTLTATKKPTLILFNQKLSRFQQRLNEIPTTRQEKLTFLATSKRSVQRLEELISECIEKGENRAQTQKTKDAVK